MYKVCVYAISKNEEQFVDRWMDAVTEADMVVVLDTGSTDRTVEKLKARGAMVYQETISPWRFDEARNRAMDYIPEDVDICVSNDLDEVFEKNWRKKLEEAWQPKHTRAKYWFVWSRNEDGRIDKKFSMEKIHRRKGFKWVHPVHEVLEYNGVGADNSVFVDDLILHHYPDNTKPRSQYLPLLELSARENPEDDRTMFWLGREYIFNQRYDEGIKTLKHHLVMPFAVWDEERCAAMRFIARAYWEMGQNNEALRWLYRAAGECPHVREPWLELGRMGYNIKNWAMVYWAVGQALAVMQPSNSYLMESAGWGYSFYDLGAIACYHLGIYQQALTYATAACALAPGDQRLKRNRELIEEKIKEVH